ncbi:hypothetical protein HDU93_008617 [Gonapodya sp. JEL0774]|nr:hypothetical protein HDU93_008617 [Gonapodya sp. JEL0774]
MADTSVNNVNLRLKTAVEKGKKQKDVYGANRFVAKVQRSEPAGRLFLYDQHRTIKLQLECPTSAPELVRLDEAVAASKEWSGIKAFMWARREGDWLRVSDQGEWPEKNVEW